MTRKMSRDEIIAKAKIEHGDWYDYSLLEDNGIDSKGKIICPIHGVFEQNMYNHIKLGHGCPKCGHAKGESNRSDRLDRYGFIWRAIQRNGYKYDYRETSYKKMHEKVRIGCDKHGFFMQYPNVHIRKSKPVGCPKCKSSIYEEKMEEYLIRNNIKFIKQYKDDFLYNKENKKYQYLDFFLPDYNIAIECHGSQHFEPKELYGGMNNLRITQERDKRKYKKCKEHGIRILYFADKKYYIPDTYLDKIYTSYQEIIDIIKALD